MMPMIDSTRKPIQTAQLTAHIPQPRNGTRTKMSAMRIAIQINSAMNSASPFFACH